MSWLLWTLIAFAAGSIPFSLLVGRWALNLDIRAVGDRNPGATNVIRAGGWRWGALALLLDYLKGALPVGIAWFLAGVQGWLIAPVALAPVAGHAFSPWLGWRGGKAVAATFGIWSGLTLGYVPTILGLMLGIGVQIFTASGWAVIFAMVTLGVHLVIFNPDPVLLAVWVGNLGILVWKHRQELRYTPEMKPGLFRREAA
ncbi:MAG: hypothetical protein GXY36_08495 [Chloroflexi bacterium]|nr:hypothetical protein [Chloroflexota bacterium]